MTSEREADVHVSLHSLVGPQAELSALNAEISHVQALLLKLTNRRDALHSYIRDTEGRMGLRIRKLPREVVTRIFTLCLPERTIVRPQANSAPLLLGSICHTWRIIALSTPKLWASVDIQITGERPSGQQIQKKVELLRTWLARAGTRPLSVSIEMPQLEGIDLHHEDMISMTCPLMDTLIQHSSTWQHISLQLPVSCFKPLVSASQDTSFPLPILESLKMESALSGWDTRIPLPTLTMPGPLRFGHAPRLQCVSLFWQQVQFSSGAMPWNQLRTLSLMFPSFISVHTPRLFTEDCLAILSQCPSLQSCSLGLSHPLSATQTVALPELHSLRVYIYGASPGTFFDSLRLPQLRTFNLIAAPSALRAWVQPVAGSLLAFLRRSSSTLEELLLHEVAFKPEQLMDCLHLVPLLTYLKVNVVSYRREYATVNEDVMRALTPSQGPVPCLIPRLRRLKLVSPYPCNLVKEFVRSRHLGLGGVAPLEAITLVLPGLRDADFRAFAKHHNEGLNITVGPHERYISEHEEYPNFVL